MTSPTNPNIFIIKKTKRKPLKQRQNIITDNRAYKVAWSAQVFVVFTLQEDQYLIKLVKLHTNTEKDWIYLTSKFNEFSPDKIIRSPRQLKERYYNHLDPELNKSDWTTAEDRILLMNHMTYGNKWKKISNFLPGR